MAEFDVRDALAVHHAMLEAIAKAVERRERMPSSAKAIEGQAEQLKIVRDKIVKQLPESEPAAFPRYRVEGLPAVT
jgi:hypothetical protein